MQILIAELLSVALE